MGEKEGDFSSRYKRVTLFRAAILLRVGWNEEV